MQRAVTDVEYRRAAAQGGESRLGERAAVVLVHQPDDFLDGHDPLALVPAEEFQDVGMYEDLSAGNIPVPEAEVRRFERQLNS